MSYPRTRSRKVWLPLSVVTAVCAVVALVAATSSIGATKATPIKIGWISTCKGPFAPFYEATLLGAAIALVDAGGKPAGSNPSQGVKGLNIGGHPVKQYFGCSDATPDVALAEARRLVEQVGVDILIAPLSGSEGIAIARYSKTKPTKTFLNGTSGAQDTTLKVRSPNFFRFHTDGAQWMAGIGDYAYNTLKLHTVVTIGDDYDFPYTQTAGFVAEFCAIGGKIPKRIWPPLGTKDYSSYIAQIPKTGIDGFYLTVGGTGTVAFVKEYLQSTTGNLSKKIIFGSVALDPIVVAELGPRVIGGVTGTDMSADSGNPLRKKYFRETLQYYPKLGAGAAGSLFSADYWNNTYPVLLALKQVGGDLSGGQSKLRAALNSIGTTGLNTPEGFVKLDQNRNAIGNNYLIQLKSLAGGLVSDDPHDPERDRVVRRVLHDLDADAVADVPAVRQEEAALVGGSLPVRAAEEVDGSTRHHVAATQEATQSAEPILRLRGVGRRFGGSGRCPRRRPRCRGGRAPGDPRPERGRQDDAVQRHRRRLSGDLWSDRDLRAGRHVQPGTTSREARALPDIPAVEAALGADGRGQHLPRHRRLPVGPSEAGRVTAARR